GGGMGMTHGDTKTFPRTGDVMGFCGPDQVVDLAEKVVTVQRDWGDRENRSQARLKYTIEKHGVAGFRAEVERRLGYQLGESGPFTSTSMGDVIGWRQSSEIKPANTATSKTDNKKGVAKGKTFAGRWHLTLFVENGRIKDVAGRALRMALREIAANGGVD